MYGVAPFMQHVACNLHLGAVSDVEEDDTDNSDHNYEQAVSEDNTDDKNKEGNLSLCLYFQPLAQRVVAGQ